MPAASSAADLTQIQAYLFDLDGVLTPTVEVHTRAWAQLLSPVFAASGVEPYSERDYFAYIDGKPRFDGVRDALASRSISLPYGELTDPPEAQTVCGLGNRKNDEFRAVLDRDGVQPYPGSARFLARALQLGKRVAVVSSSRNAPVVLAAAGLAEYFEIVIDGEVAAAHGLPGKPAPDTYLAAAEALGIAAERCAVVEDAESGVAAGRAGGFGLVIGIDRGVGAEQLRRFGADIVVPDLDVLVASLDDEMN